MVNYIETSKKIKGMKSELAEKITVVQNEKYPDHMVPISSFLKEERIKLIELLGELLLEDTMTALNIIDEWGIKTGEIVSEQGISIDMALDELNYYRKEFSEIILDKVVKQGLSIKDYHYALLHLGRIMDQAAQSFSKAFVNHHNQMIKKANNEIDELSVPVVPLEKGVAVLPLIGTLDTHRAKLLMEKSLKRSSALGIRYLILDLSGVPIVDTMVAHQIFQVTKALKLLGVEAAITGIRPEISQTMVTLGIDFRDIKIYSTLEQALKHIK